MQNQRQRVDGDGYTLYREPGRTIIQEGDQYFIRQDENQRFDDLGGNVQRIRRRNTLVTIYTGQDGDQIITTTDRDGRLIRRVKRFPGGREIVLIDNTYQGSSPVYNGGVVLLPPPPLELPPERYIVDADTAPEGFIYEALTAPPVARLPRRYTLDEIRGSPDLRNHMRSVDLNTINFETGSWEITPDQAARLQAMAQALLQAVQQNPREIYLIEGHTDAVGSAVDNLSLSDRRAQAVATVLTRNYAVPPENLTTQGYGAQYLKVQTQDASRENRRVTVRRITPLLNGK